MAAVSTRWLRNGLLTLLVALALTACGAAVSTGAIAAPDGTATGAPHRPGTADSSPGATRVLTSTPPTGAGGTTFVIAGSGFPPAATLYAVGRDPEREFVLRRTITSAADGSLRLPFDSLGQAPGTYTVTIAADFAAAMAAGGDAPLAHGTFVITAGGPTPTLTLEPARGPCATPDPAVVARGHNFPPGAEILLPVVRVDTNRALGQVQGLVAADGTFAIPVRIEGCDPQTPEGARFRINAVRLRGAVDRHAGLANATFVVSTTAPPLPAVPTPSPDLR